MAATTQKTDVATIPPLSTGGKIAPIVPQTWNEAVQMAGAIVRAGMVPKHYENSVEKATVAILAGLEVGLTPLVALQSIFVINNTPTLYGDGLLGLVRGSGLLEDIQETIDTDKNGVPQFAICRVKRKGEATWGEQIVTRAQCAKAGWLTKAGPWTLTPGRMMQFRARTWALRDRFADVLKGLKGAEEMEDIIDITPAGAATVPEPKRSDFVEKPVDTAQPTEKPEVTDVVEIPPQHAQPGQQLQFASFPSETWVEDFMAFAEEFLPKTNPLGAAQFLVFYKDGIEAMEEGLDAWKEAAKWVRDTAAAIKPAEG